MTWPNLFLRECTDLPVYTEWVGEPPAATSKKQVVTNTHWQQTTGRCLFFPAHLTLFILNLDRSFTLVTWMTSVIKVISSQQWPKWFKTPKLLSYVEWCHLLHQSENSTSSSPSTNEDIEFWFCFLFDQKLFVFAKLQLSVEFWALLKEGRLRRGGVLREERHTPIFQILTNWKIIWLAFLAWCALGPTGTLAVMICYYIYMFVLYIYIYVELQDQ